MSADDPTRPEYPAARAELESLADLQLNARNAAQAALDFTLAEIAALDRKYHAADDDTTTDTPTV